MLDKIFNYFEDFEQAYKFSMRPLCLTAVFVGFWLIHASRHRLGDILPDPINVFNYIGNVDSIIPALLFGFIVGLITSKTLRLTKRQLLLSGIIAGVLIGFICNLLIEIPLGMRLLNEYNVSDPLDVIWGTIFCIVACFAAFKVTEKDASSTL